METRTPTRHDDATSIARWEGEGGARKSPAEEERDTRDARVNAESRQRPCATTSKKGGHMRND
jgi:hypothetical protein